MNSPMSPQRCRLYAPQYRVTCPREYVQLFPPWGAWKRYCAAQDGKNGRGQPSSFLVLSQIFTQSSMHENPPPWRQHIATRLVIWGDNERRKTPGLLWLDDRRSWLSVIGWWSSWPSWGNVCVPLSSPFVPTAVVPGNSREKDSL